VGYAPPGKSKDQNGNIVNNLQFMAGELDNMRGGHSVAIPNVFDETSKERLYDVKVLETPDRGEMFIDLMTYYDILKLRALWIAEKTLLSAGGRTGTFAESEVQAEATMRLFEKEARNFDYHINTFVLPQLVMYNFGVEAMRKTPATFHTSGFRKVDKVLLGHIMRNILEAQREIEGKTIKNAHLVDIEKLYRENNIPYQNPQEAVKGGATADFGGFEKAQGAQDSAQVPGSRTKQPKDGERVSRMPGQ
jgi:hypothetical protein